VAPHRRTLAAIEHTKLDAGRIGNPAHQTVERIDLTDQMALAEPPIAGLQDIAPMVANDG